MRADITYIIGAGDAESDSRKTEAGKLMHGFDFVESRPEPTSPPATRMENGLMTAIMKRVVKLRAFLGLEHNILVLAAAGIVQAFGVGLWASYLPKVLEALGATSVAIGAFATVGSLLGIVLPYIGGVLSDRLGRGRLMVLAGLLAAAGYLTYALAPVWWAFLPGAVLTAAAGSFGFMGGLALTGESVRSGRRGISIASRGILGTVPGILAPPVGGFLILKLGLVPGVRAALCVTVALTLAAVWLQQRYYRFPSVARGPASGGARAPRTAMSPGLRNLLAADCLLRFGSGMSATFVVLYVLNVLKAGAVTFGFLVSLETMTAALLVLPVSRLSDRRGMAGRHPFVVAAFFFFTVFPLALAALPSAEWLVPVFVLSGLRHACEPARKALVIDLSDAPDRGRLLGVYHSIRGAVVFPAALAGGLLWEWMPAATFITGSAVSSLGLLWLVLSGPATGRAPAAR